MTKRYDDFEYKLFMTILNTNFLTSKQNVKQFLICLEYEVRVHTGKVINAGTNANVYIQITGGKGDSEIHHINKSKKNSVQFERGS